MPDVRKWIDRACLHAVDLDGRDVAVEIDRVVPGEVTNIGGKKKMPMVYFKGKQKPLGVNSTNIATIASIAGSYHSEKWPGVRITLYVTTTRTKDGIVDCIRVRPNAPGKASDDRAE